MPGLRLHRPAALVLALPCLLFAQGSERDQGFRADLALLARELPARHTNVFHTTTRERFDAAVEALDRDIPRLGDTEVIVRLAQIVASVGDSHTNLTLPQGPAPFRRFPFTFYGFEDGWRVDAATRDYTRLLGCRILRIGDMPIDEVYTRVATVIARENEPWLKRQFPSAARWADVLKTVGVIDSLDSARWAFETLAGEQFSLDLPTVAQNLPLTPVTLPDSEGYLPLHRRNLSRYYWFTYLESSRTLYFAYNQCAEAPDLPFFPFAEELFRTFDSKPVDRLILDLRNNTGGRSTVLNPFIDTVQARGYRFAAGTRKYVIIGRSTASSAVLNAITLKRQPYTVLIGEPTGGNPNSYGELYSMKLPYSGATVNYSTRFVTTGFTGESVVPDWPVPTHARDTFSRHDPFLAAALAGGPPPAAPADPAPLVNSASYRPGPVAPGSLATLFVSLPGLAAEMATVPYPERLAGVEARIGGQAARLLAVTPGQVNMLVPADLPAGRANLQAFRDGVEVFSTSVLIATSSPGLFLADPTQPGQPGAVLNQDLRLNTKETRARRGEMVRVFATGLMTPPRAFAAGEPAVVFNSSPSEQFPGVWQIDIVLPGAEAAAGQVPLFLIGENGVVSNGVTPWVEP